MEQTNATPKTSKGEYYSLPPLPYAKDALEPTMSPKTLDVHYGKHHEGYVDKLNKLIAGTEFESQPIESVIRKASGPLYNNAAQAWNHTFFWNCLTPSSSEPKSGNLLKAIEAAFGSLTEFKTQFSKTGEDLFGSGYVWLVKNKKDELEIKSGSNAYNPMTEGLTPLFTVDVWEHAYYLDHLNLRKDYLQNIWKIANWDFVQARYSTH